MNRHTAHNRPLGIETFSTDAAGLAPTTPPVVAHLADGDTFDLRIAPVAKAIDGARVRMLAYNGSIPGPTIRVRQGSEITVSIRNEADLETTVHWHGLRLDNASDGVPHQTQDPIAVGEDYACTVRFPDPGLYWYHPHVREDYGLEMGLYANIVVDPEDVDYWPPVDREHIVTLDDLLVEGGRVAPFNVDGPTHVAMGRFGNVMLTAGETSPRLSACTGEVVRFFFTNTANTRIFSVAIPGCHMKLVGGDSGRYEHEVFVDDVLLAPSERAIVDVLFGDEARAYTLEHRTPDRTYVLGTINVAEGRGSTVAASTFAQLRTSSEMTAERRRLDADRDRAPDKVLAFDSLMPLLNAGEDSAVEMWTCPMHPDVTSSTQTRCPRCGMKLVPATASSSGAQDNAGHGHGQGDAMADGLELEDLMPEMNRVSDTSNMTWKLVDRATGKENGDIDWTFTVGDRIKIRLENGMDQDHPMHHPFHVHGAGRFLVLCRNGRPDDNLVWKDTVLVRAGETVDILLDVTNVGHWMAHCHIAEHHQAGMMFSFAVEGVES